MDFPDPRVQKIIEYLKKDLNSEEFNDLTIEIEGLSLSQRFQIFCLIKDRKIFPPELFPLENKIWEKFHELFRNDYTETSFLTKNYDNSLELAGIALLTGLLDLEDYRTIIRFLYTNVEDYANLMFKLNENLLHYLRVRSVGSQVLSVFNLLLEFLGIPLVVTDKLKNDLLEFFPELKSEINDFFEQPIATMQRYPEYLDEMAEQLNYDRNLPILKDWLDHETLFKLERIKVNHFIKSWKPRVSSTVNELVADLKGALNSNNLSSIPLVFNSFIKPFSAFLKPHEVKSNDLSSKIPPEMLQTYVEKLGYPILSHKEVKIKITFLGGAQIGTMGILISTPQSTILIDYGMSVANYQIPYWIREADHRFKYLSRSAYVYQMLDRYVTIKAGEEYQFTPDIVIKPIPAYHIQGSFAYLVECGSKRILFSGDMNLDSTALFVETPQLPNDADLSIIDGTYYGQPAFDPRKRDQLLFKAVKEDDRVIIPAFSVGRAQEVMIKLEKAGLTKERKISLLGMATKVARISGLKTKGHLSDHLVQPFDDEVVITGGGMLSGGYARELVEESKNDPNTTIILCGFLAKNTLGYRLLHELEPQYRQKIVFTRFSSHSSSETLSSYLESIKGKKVLVHLGSLTKDPFTTEKVRKLKEFSRQDYYIPSLGSSLEI